MKIFQINNSDYAAENAINDILINPDLPNNFFTMHIDDRSQRHLEKWFCLPFVLTHEQTFKVLCLDNNSDVMPSELGAFDNLEEAVNFANTQKLS